MVSVVASIINILWLTLISKEFCITSIYLVRDKSFLNNRVDNRCFHEAFTVANTLFARKAPVSSSAHCTVTLKLTITARDYPHVEPVSLFVCFTSCVTVF